MNNTKATFLVHFSALTKSLSQKHKTICFDRGPTFDRSEEFKKNNVGYERFIIRPIPYNYYFVEKLSFFKVALKLISRSLIATCISCFRAFTLSVTVVRNLPVCTKDGLHLHCIDL